MAINTGTVLGRYEIRSPLGAGGMGEVYLALDTQLERTVALKVLPAEVASDQKRMGRFRQEARAASTLNHPNVAHIYEIGEEGGVNFIAMEFVEGLTLRHEMARIRTKMTEALEIALQVASALSAAHAAGIVHRDIKPENIMLRPDGYVKVLDFGLAKLTETRAGTSEASTLINTDPGVVVGTVHYMSPEQARGLEVDARTDIFSFGVVLYEMIAGRAPFEAETKSDVVSSILNDEPPPLARYARDVPETLEFIVVKALRKDREERYQTAKELLTDLRSLKRRIEFAVEQERSLPPDASASGFGSASSQTMETLADAAVEPLARTEKLEAARSTSSVEYLVSEIKQHRRGVMLALAGIVILAIAGVLLALKYVGRNQTATKSVEPFARIKVSRLTNTGKASDAAISPDGKYIVHVMGGSGQQSLWLRHIATGSDKEIVPAAEGDLSQPTFSQDGNYVYYNRRESGEGMLYQVPVLGGPSRKLVRDIDSSITLSPDGKRMAFVRGDPTRLEASLIVAKADGTEEQKLVTHNIRDIFPGRAVGPAWGPAWSPDGETIAFALWQSETNAEYRSLMAVRVADGAQEQITQQRWSLIGAINWVRDGSGLITIAADQESGSIWQVWHVSYPGGEARRITNDVSNYRGLSLTADSAALVTVQTDRFANVWAGPSTDPSRATQITSARYDGMTGISWTPDNRIVYTSRASGSPDIWIMKPDGTENRQLTFNARSNIRPTVSPDGRYILFASNRTGAYNVWRMDVDGSNPKRLTNGSEDQRPQGSPDGQWVIYTSTDGSKQTIWKVPVDGGTPRQLTDYTSQASAISPDGKQILSYYIDEQASPRRNRVAVIPIEGGPPTKAFDFPPLAIQTLGWTVDGRALTYLDARAGIFNVWAQPIDGSPRRQLTDFKSDQIFNYAWSRDGKQLALSRGNETSDVIMITDLK